MHQSIKALKWCLHIKISDVIPGPVYRIRLSSRPPIPGPRTPRPGMSLLRHEGGSGASVGCGAGVGPLRGVQHVSLVELCVVVQKHTNLLEGNSWNENSMSM